jgi:hypothetical protein
MRAGQKQNNFLCFWEGDMKAIRLLVIFVLVLGLHSTAAAGNGPGGGKPTPKPVPSTSPVPSASPVPSPSPTAKPDTGQLYGDLYVILRDESGVPVLSASGCIQPISTTTATTTIATSTGDLVINVLEGEPFALPTYTDTAGDLVECELTEAMANWVEAVDFGRLNLGRAPDSVAAHAFDEAIKKMNVANAITLDPAGRLFLSLPSAEDPTIYEWKTIDAPAEALGLYIEMMKYGDWVLPENTPVLGGGSPETIEYRPVLNSTAIGFLSALGFTNLGVNDTITTLNNAELTLAASLLAAAADKTGSISLDKVMYINSIYGINQLGTVVGETEGKLYYNFGAFNYDRSGTYAMRGSPECASVGASYVYVLQPEADTDGNPLTLHYVSTCMDLLGYEAAHDPTVNAVRYTDMVESYMYAGTYEFNDNVRAFTQAADDALQTIEYIHNYKIPAVLYP